MRMKKKPLTPEQLEDQARLKDAWIRAKDKDSSLTQARVAELVELGSQSNVSHYFNGTNALNVKALAQFSALFGVSPYEISPTLAKELDAYSRAMQGDARSERTAERRQGGRRASDVESPNIEEGPLLTRVPLISWVQAGDFCEAVDPFEPGDADEWVDVVKRVGPNTYALRVKGESMEPRFTAGSILIVDPSIEALPGSFVIAKEGGECTFKQFVKDGLDWYLKPLNDRFPVKAFREGMSICGVVVMHLQELR